MRGHTPGPWRYVHGCIYAGEEHAGLRLIIAIPTEPKNSDHPSPEIFSAEYNTHEAVEKANALLIAAAPEMLAALQAVVLVADRKTNEFDLARAAIAKATKGTPQ